MYLLAFFVLAAIADWFSVAWQSARERQQMARLVALSMALESLTWIPVWFALTWEDWRVAAASVLGSAAGAAFGLTRVAGQNSDSVVSPISVDGGSPASSPPFEDRSGE